MGKPVAIRDEAIRQDLMYKMSVVLGLLMAFIVYGRMALKPIL
jgi:hypothetical protein